MTEHEAKDKEKELIKYYKTNDRNLGYNLTEGGDGTCGFTPTTAKHVYQFDKDFNLINEFNSGLEAAVFLNSKSGNHILECCKHERISFKNCYWSFNNDPYELKEYISLKKIESHEKKRSSMIINNPRQYREYKKGYKTGNAKKIIRFDLVGNYICTYNDSIDAMNDMKFKVNTNIQSCCNGNRLTCGNSLWVYEKDYINNNNIIFELVQKVKMRSDLNVS